MPGPGSRIGAYDILSPLGAGGMGEVYRARDTRLNRDVALKVLPEAFAADAERLARFEREAQALAALRHPHIATIYGIEEKDGVRALVLELVEGETLDARINAGPIAIDECVRLARQIADALEAAHEQGIVHRDLKPANIKVTPEGDVKVLDFGLAKLHTASDMPDASALSMSPTMASPAVMTGMHVLLGTVGYMAPEQARGKTVDKRADIWAFGVVLYEMLTGSRAFEGDTVTEVAGAVIHKTLDLGALPAATPPDLRMVLERCLQKDPRQRFRDAGDVRLALSGAFSSGTRGAAPAAVVGRRAPVAALAAVGVLAALIAGLAVWWWTRDASPAVEALHFEIVPPTRGTLTPLISVSPDGRTIAYVAQDRGGEPRVWLRTLDSSESRLLSATESTRMPVFWSPDGRFVGMYSGGRLKRVPVGGGPSETLAPADGFLGGSWGDGVIVFGTAAGIWRVPASGGAAVAVTKVPTGEGGHVMPSFLPDGKRFLYLRFGADEVTGIQIGDVDVAPDAQDGRRLVATRWNAAFAQTPDGGRLLFIRDGLLMAQAFDPDALALPGDASPVVSTPIETGNVLAAFGVSSSGTLVYRRASGSTPILLSLDRSGKSSPALGDVSIDQPSNPQLSPDGTRVALISAGHLWVYDRAGRPPIKLTTGGEGFFTPLWTRDGQRIVVERSGEPRSLIAFPAAGGGAGEAVGPAGHFHAHGWTANGEIVASQLGDGRSKLVKFGTAADAKIETVAEPGGGSASVSPDGRWVAYTADQTGRVEIWVRSLERQTAPVRISPNGGGEPVWSPNGREIFYLEDRRIVAVPVSAGDTFNFMPPVQLFTSAVVRGTQSPTFDVGADGLLVMFTAEDPDLPVSVVLNWHTATRAASAAH